MRSYIAAAAQIGPGKNWDETINTAEQLMERAAAQNASLIVYPEHFAGKDPEGIAGVPEESATIQRIASASARYHMWSVCGSIRTRAEKGKSYNTSVLVSPKGEISAYYHKMHLFDVTLPDGASKLESGEIAPGERPVTASTDLGMIGMSICYDLRFPELYRKEVTDGASVFTIPANFTKQTGALHWELLLRARAVENECYVIAADQPEGTEEVPSYGHSMIISPSGEILASANGPDTCVVCAEIHPDRQRSLRRSFPCLQHIRIHSF